MAFHFTLSMSRNCHHHYPTQQCFCVSNTSLFHFFQRPDFQFHLHLSVASRHSVCLGYSGGDSSLGDSSLGILGTLSLSLGISFDILGTLPLSDSSLELLATVCGLIKAGLQHSKER